MRSEMGQLRWCVVLRKPDSEFIYILIEKFGSAWISTLGDVENSFIRLLAAGADILDCLVPFRQEPVDSTAFGYMFCKPGAKLSRKSLKNPRHTVPVDQIKVIKGHETFTVVNKLCSFVGVMVMKAASRRGNKFLTVGLARRGCQQLSQLPNLSPPWP
jgi:hypothetical protein